MRFQNFWGTFLLEVENFSGRGGGLPNSKDNEELFFGFGLDIFQGKCGRITKILTMRQTLVCIK